MDTDKDDPHGRYHNLDLDFSYLVAIHSLCTVTELKAASQSPVSSMLITENRCASVERCRVWQGENRDV